MSLKPSNTKTGATVSIAGYLIKNIVGALFMVAILLIAAGRVDWIMGWVYVGLLTLGSVVSALFTDPQLLREERDIGKKGTKNWDRLLVSIHGLVSLATMIVAALDLRYGWLPEVSLAWQIVALVAYSLGWALHLWAMAVNRFFSKVIRIQTERGHTVVTEGPYRYVRHPGYAGAIPWNLGTAVALGSVWALIPGVLGALLLILRTALEDRTLQEELQGYKEYTQKVRYRLLPGVW